MRSMLVIGLGRFGGNLALKLAELGNEVFVVDKDPKLVGKIAPFVTRAQAGDCLKEEFLRELGVSNFDVCFVCIGVDFQSSMEIISLLKEDGARMVVAKTDRDMHAKFLTKSGADEVIFPERDMAQRTAIRYGAKGAFDCIELTPEYDILDVEVPKSWIGKSLADINIRNQYNFSVIGRKRGGKLTPVMNAEEVFEPGEHLLVAGEKKSLFKILRRL
jgi:trk system potassium uptake protein TrkA